MSKKPQIKQDEQDFSEEQRSLDDSQKPVTPQVNIRVSGDSKSGKSIHFGSGNFAVSRDIEIGTYIDDPVELSPSFTDGLYGNKKEKQGIVKSFLSALGIR